MWMMTYVMMVMVVVDEECNNLNRFFCIYFFRMHLLEHMPSSLPKLLSAVKWSQHKDVAVVSV